MNKSIKDALKANDALGFQEAFKTSLSDALKEKVQALQEEMSDLERTALLKLQIGAKGFGASAESTVYDQGVFITLLKNKLAASHFCDWLDECPFVDSYEIDILIMNEQSGMDEKTDKVDFEDIIEGSAYDFEFTVYLVPGVVNYDYEEDYTGDLPVGNYDIMDEAVEDIAEAKRTIRVNFRGVKRIKMKCQKGFKWDPNAKTCTKIGGAALAVMRKSVRKALITKRNEGSSLRKRVTRKRNKALKYRRSYGL